MRQKKNYKKAPTAFLMACILAVAGACTGNETEDDVVALSALAYLNSLNLVIAGTWTDTSDSDAKYTITNSQYSHLEYLGSGSPKDDYDMSIVAYTSDILKVSGLQLNFAGWPTVTTSSNTIFTRIRFAVTDASTFYYCSEVSNKNSLSELDADTTTYTFTGASDATCNGFTWSKMVRR